MLNQKRTATLARHYLTKILLSCLFCMVFAASATAYDENSNDEPMLEEYLFSVVYPPNWTIAPIMPAYEKEGKFYLPILELAEGFEFYAEDQEIDRSYVSGFAASEDYTYVLDGINHQIIVNGETIDIDPDSILSPEVTNSTDVYVQIEVLNQLWPIKLQVNLSTLTISSSSDVVMAFEKRKERDENRVMQLSRREQRQEALQGRENFKEIENNPKAISKPIVDIQALYKYSQDDNNITGQTNISASHQVAGLIADYAGNINLDESGNFREPRNIRLKLWRESGEGEHIFIKGLKNIEMGDINVRQPSLVGNSIGGRGVVLSNIGKKGGQEFDEIVVEGRGPIGWEIEIYNNTELIASGEVDNNGEYRFEDVALNFGNNEIRTVLYGPQGQIREEKNTYTIGGNMLSPGEFQYYMGLTDKDRFLIPLNDDRTLTDEGIGHSYSARFGIHERATLFAAYNRQPNDDGDKQYLSGGAALSTPVGLGNVEFYKELNGGNALDTSFITRLLGVRLSLKNAIFNRFESEDAGYGTNAKKMETEADAKTTLSLPFAALGLNVNYKRTKRQSKTITEEYKIGQSLSKAGLRLNHSTTHRYIDGTETGASGRLDANYRDGDWQYRSNFSYAIAPERSLNSGGFEVRYKPGRFQTAWGTTYNFVDDIATHNLQLGYQFDKALTSFDLNHQDHRGWEMTLRATTSLYPYNKENAYRLSSSTQRRATPIKAFVYQDYNFNSQYDEDVDTPLSDVFIDRNGARSRSKTDENGEVLIYGAKDRKTALSLNSRSLGNPYFAPAEPGFITTPRIASMPIIEFPVIETGAVDGQVFNGVTNKAVGGIKIELLNSDGSLEKTTLTSYDGFYVFEFVKPGDYTVKIAREYKKTIAEPVQVSLNSDNLFAYDANIAIFEEGQVQAESLEDSGEQNTTQAQVTENDGVVYIEW